MNWMMRRFLNLPQDGESGDDPMVRSRGVVTKWWSGQGFGFLEPIPPNGETLFIHVTDIAGGPKVCVGDEIEFERIITHRGPRAIKAVRVEFSEVERSEAELNRPQ